MFDDFECAGLLFDLGWIWTSGQGGDGCDGSSLLKVLEEFGVFVPYAGFVRGSRETASRVLRCVEAAS